MRSQRASRLGALATCLAAIGLMIPSVSIAGGPQLYLPDLRMAKLTDLRVTYDSARDRHLLRFTATILNMGDGAFVIRAERDCAGAACPTMDAQQRVRTSDGTWTGDGYTGVAEYDVGDGHSHWHAMDVESYELIPLDTPPEEAAQNVQGSKVGFCFFDTTPRDLTLPRSPNQPRFESSGCGVPDSTSIRVGLSVGWGDTYPWYLPRQWINLKTVPSGDYLVCATADPLEQWTETDDTNNQTWTEIHLERQVGDIEITSLGDGRSPCATRLPAALKDASWRASLPRAEAIPLSGSERIVCRIEDA